jgi:hypothetical protein
MIWNEKVVGIRQSSVSIPLTVYMPKFKREDKGNMFKMDLLQKSSGVSCRKYLMTLPQRGHPESIK